MPRSTPALAGFAAWMTALGDAWEAADAQAMAALFALGASMQPGPFAELVRGRRLIGDFWQAELEGVHEVSFRAQVLGAGDTYGVAHFRVSYNRGEGGPARLRDGILLVALDTQGRCASLRSWWHDAEGQPESS